MKKKPIKICFAVLAIVSVVIAAVLLIGKPERSDKDFEAKATSYVGSCGENIRWSLNTVTGILSFEGKGKFKAYDSPDDIPWRAYEKYINEAKFDNGITEIAPFLFYRFKHLSSVDIPRSVQSIGEEAFYGCTSLISVNFEENSSLKTIGNSAFAYCRSLKAFKMPTRVVSIGNNSFLCCYDLSDMVLGYSVKSVGEGAFSSCSNLKKLRIVNYDCNIFDDGETIYRNIIIEGFGSSTAKDYADKYLRKFSVIRDMNNINDMKVRLEYNEAVYDGKKKKPEVIVKGLKKNRDYTVNYSNNLEPGIAFVTVSAAGSTLGEVTLDFRIKPQRPKSLRLRAASKNSLTLTWNEVHGASGYQLYQYVNKKWKKVAETSLTDTKIKNLKSAREYTFKVRAFVETDSGKIYGKFSSACSCATRPEKVKLTSVVNRGVGRLTLSWERVSGADGYIVYTSFKQKSGYKEAKVIKGSSNTKCVLTGLRSNKKYFVTVKSFKNSENGKTLSADGNVKSKSPM
ncbi:MAG: leucine-rich repeat protein [Oscillospiraceae bacterium]|nr:leucine-rich repeat protein [Oscillospiraceae bacterium]